MLSRGVPPTNAKRRQGCYPRSRRERGDEAFSSDLDAAHMFRLIQRVSREVGERSFESQSRGSLARCAGGELGTLRSHLEKNLPKELPQRYSLARGKD